MALDPFRSILIFLHMSSKKNEVIGLAHASFHGVGVPTFFARSSLR